MQPLLSDSLTLLLSRGWGRKAPQSLSARAGSWQQLQSSSASSLLISGLAKGDPAVSGHHWHLPSSSHGRVWLQPSPGWDGDPQAAVQSCAFNCRPTLTFSTSQQKGLQKTWTGSGVGAVTYALRSPVCFSSCSSLPPAHACRSWLLAQAPGTRH